MRTTARLDHWGLSRSTHIWLEPVGVYTRPSCGPVESGLVMLDHQYGFAGLSRECGFIYTKDKKKHILHQACLVNLCGLCFEVLADRETLLDYIHVWSFFFTFPPLHACLDSSDGKWGSRRRLWIGISGRSEGHPKDACSGGKVEMNPVSFVCVCVCVVMF